MSFENENKVKKGFGNKFNCYERETEKKSFTSYKSYFLLNRIAMNNKVE